MEGTSNIVSLTDRLARRKPIKHPILGADRYFCLACDTDKFVILADGTVHCASCTARTKNLMVSDGNNPAA